MSLRVDDVGWWMEDDGIAVVEMRGAPDNYFSASVIGQIADSLEAIDSNPAARCAVLASVGKNFCAGAAFGDRGVEHEGDRHIYDEAARLFRTQTPIVAAIQGAAVGGGLGLAMVADVRIATPSSKLWANFAAIGLHQGFALSVTLPYVLGRHRATRLLLEAVRLTGEEALVIGLVDELVEVPDLRQAAIAHARRIAANAPLGVRAIRQTMRANLADEAVRAMHHERHCQEELTRTKDFREGVHAVAERRTPVFRAE